MNDSWDDRRKAKEDEYFAKENLKALERLKTRTGSEIRKSPITGEPMEQVTIMGVVVDRCPKSGGVWLDKGELEQLMGHHTADPATTTDSKLTTFFRDLFGTSK